MCPFPLRKPPHVNKAAGDGAVAVVKVLEEKLDFSTKNTTKSDRSCDGASGLLTRKRHHVHGRPVLCRQRVRFYFFPLAIVRANANSG